MTARERLDSHLNYLRRRLCVHIYMQAFAALLLGVLLITCAAVWLLAQREFDPSVTLAARILMLFLALAVAGLLLWAPLRRLHRRHGADVLEQRMPEQDGRIRTYLDGVDSHSDASRPPSVLLDLLAEDAVAIAERTPLDVIAPARKIALATTVAALAVLALALLLSVGPGHWGFASRHVLLGAQLPREAVPVRRVVVSPGDATVRRNSDLAIHATVEGFRSRGAQVFVRFHDQADWERAPMQNARDDQSKFDFKLYAVRGPLSYYVDAGGARSAQHSVAVVDLPMIERVRLTYEYPEWTGLAPVQDEAVRDIRAVEGSRVKVEVFADAPLQAPALIVSGAAHDMRQENAASVGVIEVAKPGRYQIGARVAGEFVALSDEYAIEITPDEKPSIEIRRPGRDWRATSIEEVPVRIEAQDDFRLRSVELRYSVNGGDWRALRVGGGAPRSDSESLLRLEKIGAQLEGAGRLSPGDLVSYYAVARDRRRAVQTDLFMVQVQPFERTFRQAQGGAPGAGGMSDEQGAISERQREILLATWNLQRNDDRNARSREQLRDSASMLAELQTRLAQQAQTLAQRTRARASLDDQRIRTFVESLEGAAQAMDPAAKHLRQFRLSQALPVEQQALQQVLRAESAFRDVQVSMQQNGAADGAQAARNFTEMFELEMDLEKNQYESESQLSMQNRQQELEETIRKLKELAQRQERLAQEAGRTPMRAEEQRWKQEQLRREAEDLRRRLAEVNRQQQRRLSDSSAAQAQGGAAGERSGEESGDDESAGSRSAASGEAGRERERRELQQALDSVNRALEDMRAANERAGGDQLQSAQSAAEAGQNLRRALSQIDSPTQSAGLDESLERLAQRTRALSNEQRRIESQLYRALQQSDDLAGSRAAIERRTAERLVRSKQQLGADLSALQGDMRSAVHEHRRASPQTTRRVSEIIRDMEASDVMHRINRSAAEIYYGHVREAAMREGLVSEALEMLERDLREAAALAAREAQGSEDSGSPEALLSEVAELRRTLQAHEGARRSADGSDRRGSEASSRTVARGSRQAHGERRADQEAAQGGESSGDIDNTRVTTPELEVGQGSLARETEAIGRRVRDAVNRMGRGELTPAEFEALRQRANELRRLAGDPMAAQREEMLELIDQIELAALAAAPRLQDPGAARATPPAPDAPAYREAVAEYYRRLGDR
ncbi:MAG: hypothetical protein RBS02_13630 [Steroidobacteraceae bacterium]|jgi:hypothetical protein|nr:hypothetical protein [Steroidobacteraceae bacterium]